MADERKPRVAVIGGFYDLDTANRQLGQSARVYAEQLGAALAGAGFGLVVYFSDDKSLEPHVVRGFVGALPGATSEACIDMRYSEAQRGQVAFAEQAVRPSLFQERVFPSSDWEAPFYRSLAERDGVHAVVLMAGGTSTLNAGQVAVGRGLPVLAIGQYPGSAQRLRTELATRQDDYPQGQDPAQLVTWLRGRQAADAKARSEAEQRESDYLRMTSQTHGMAWLAFALVALVVALGLGVGATTPNLFLTAVGLSLLMAGASGALVRGVTTTTMRLDPRLACLLGAGAGLVVGLAFLIPQFIGASKIFDPTATAIEATSKIQLLSVVLVAFAGGIGFDVIFRRMLQEADKVRVIASS